MAFAYIRAITINASLCGTANSTNFPVLFTGGTYLATTANGGQVQSASGFDIAFYADAALTQKLNWETVNWAATTGAGEWWVQIPTLSASANTVFYVAYGDATITADQSARTATYTAADVAVIHDPATGTDSTANANSGTPVNVTSATGMIGGAGTFDGSSSYLSIGNATSLGFTGAFTLQAWVNMSYYSSLGVVVGKGYDGSNEPWALEYASALKVEQFNGSGFSATDSASSYVTGQWYLWTAAFDGANTLTLYSNGVQKATGTGVAGLTSAQPVVVGAFNFQGGIQRYFPGSIDEVRIANVARSASWVLAQYNNQSSPTTFYSVGSAQTPGPTTTSLRPVFWRMINR